LGGIENMLMSDKDALGAKFLYNKHNKNLRDLSSEIPGMCPKELIKHALVKLYVVDTEGLEGSFKGFTGVYSRVPSILGAVGFIRGGSLRSLAVGEVLDLENHVWDVCNDNPFDPILGPYFKGEGANVPPESLQDRFSSETGDSISEDGGLFDVVTRKVLEEWVGEGSRRSPKGLRKKTRVNMLASYFAIRRGKIFDTDCVVRSGRSLWDDFRSHDSDIERFFGLCLTPLPSGWSGICQPSDSTYCYGALISALDVYRERGRRNVADILRQTRGVRPERAAAPVSLSESVRNSIACHKQVWPPTQ
jgi:hypothetical protein